MTDPIPSATTLFANVLITTFSAAITALTAAGTVTALSEFFDLRLEFLDLLLEPQFFQFIAIFLSVSAQATTTAHLSEQYDDYAYCVWMGLLTVIAVVVGVATGIMLSVVLSHLVGIAVEKAMGRINVLKRSERKEDLAVAHLGIILVYLAATLTLLGAVYVGTAWLGSVAPA